MTDESHPLGWFVIQGEELLQLLRRVRDGEDPDFVLMEFFANSELVDED